MLTGFFTIVALFILLGSLFSKVLCLARRGVFARKDFLWSSLELVLSALSLGFLLVITVVVAYDSTVNEFTLAQALESSIYLYIGGFLFTIVGFLWIVELFTIIVRDIWDAKKGYMPSRKRSFIQKNTKSSY